MFQPRPDALHSIITPRVFEYKHATDRVVYIVIFNAFLFPLHWTSACVTVLQSTRTAPTYAYYGNVRPEGKHMPLSTTSLHPDSELQPIL
ncbi:uncharacterized protein ARMOST_05943 [Armillaria ostoyae]|uniref:Uncharacterized protein n=1 Tax=Armillaria ostoyae TaxID=47428 RepID=A0A284R1N8_ARMOS|nr:uncharacterized protein ARMOST_05943 [Armillaria ostoyae]